MSGPLDLEPIKARVAAGRHPGRWRLTDDGTARVTDHDADLAALIAEVERLRMVACDQWRKIEGEWGSFSRARDASDQEILAELT